MQLSNDEIRRYARHLSLPEVGLAGQEKIRAASVLCADCGSLNVSADTLFAPMICACPDNSCNRDCRNVIWS